MERERICGHIRSLKVSSECRMQANPAPQQDVKTLTLSPNPAPQSSDPSSSDTERPQFVCPLTLKVMNGAQPFAYLFAWLRLHPGRAEDRLRLIYESDKGKAKAATTDPSDAELELCPQCGKKYSQTEDVILLNPSQDEEDAMREAMERKRLLEPVKKPKSSKKRKNDSPTDDAEHPAKKQAVVGPSAKISAASQAVVSGLAMEEAKRKSEMSDAVKSLYGNGTKRKETFMTMNTFTRVCLSSGFDLIFNPDSSLTVCLMACVHTTRQCATTWNSFYTVRESNTRVHR
jgi:hypothetical protein